MYFRTHVKTYICILSVFTNNLRAENIICLYVTLQICKDIKYQISTYVCYKQDIQLLQHVCKLLPTICICGKPQKHNYVIM